MSATDKELDELEARLVGIEVGMGVRDPAKYLAGLTVAEAIQIRDALSTLRKEKAGLRDALWNLLLDDAVCTLEDAARSDPYDTKRAKDLSELFKDARAALKGKETP